MLSFRQKIFLSYASVFIAILVVIYPSANFLAEQIQQRNLKKHVLELIDEVKEAKSLPLLISELAQESKTLFFRISLLDPHEGLLYDSTKVAVGEVMAEENHLAHPEVEEAFRKDYGYDVRFSPLFNQQVAFMALAFDFQGKEYVLRAGFPYGQISAITRDFTFTFLALLILVLLIFGFMAWTIVHYLTLPVQQIINAIKPYQQGKVEKIPFIKIENKTVAKDEFGRLAATLNSLSERIAEQITTLKAERNDKAAILESLGEGVVAVDEMMTVIFCNDLAETYLQCKKEEIIGNSFALTRQREMHQLIREAKEQKEPVSEVIISSEKPRKYLDALAVPRRKGVGTILVLQDKTGLHKVLELGRDFVANASHELKTPITIIRGFAETLHDHPELSKEVSREITEKIVSNCQRMDVLVRNLLTLAGLDEGIPSSRQQQVDLKELIEQAKQTTLAVHPDAKITLCVAETAPRLMGDSDLLFQAFLNLLDNAAKYSTPPANIHVTIETKGNLVAIAFEDQGVGIPSEDLDLIFERFFAVDKSHSRALGGSGLGLSIVEQIVERHKGKIEVASTPNVGTTFTLLFPKG